MKKLNIVICSLLLLLTSIVVVDQGDAGSSVQSLIVDSQGKIHAQKRDGSSDTLLSQGTESDITVNSSGDCGSGNVCSGTETAPTTNDLVDVAIGTIKYSWNIVGNTINIGGTAQIDLVDDAGSFDLVVPSGVLLNTDGFLCGGSGNSGDVGNFDVSCYVSVANSTEFTFRCRSDSATPSSTATTFTATCAISQAP